jgi:hypothetical protein
VADALGKFPEVEVVVNLSKVTIAANERAWTALEAEMRQEVASLQSSCREGPRITMQAVGEVILAVLKLDNWKWTPAPSAWSTTSVLSAACRFLCAMAH